MSSSLSIVCLYYADRRFSRFRLGARGADGCLTGDGCDWAKCLTDSATERRAVPAAVVEALPDSSAEAHKETGGKVANCVRGKCRNSGSELGGCAGGDCDKDCKDHSRLAGGSSEAPSPEMSDCPKATVGSPIGLGLTIGVSALDGSTGGPSDSG